MSLRPSLVAAVFSLALLGAGAVPSGASPAGGSLETLFNQGNAAYAKGDFESAEQAYRAIVARGIRNSRVFYNLGNACFRRNEIGNAILYYEKALRLDPGDADARENLRYASLRIRDRIPPDETPFLIALFGKARDFLSLEQVTRLFVALYLGAMTVLAAWILLRRRRGAALLGALGAILLALALSSGGWMVLRAGSLEAHDEAIVLAPKLDVFSGPGNENTLLASVHEGTKVRIHARRDFWVQVTLPDGRAGWLMGETLGVI
jgi:tetratricopeptide (TPR) repeat protein